LKLSAYRSGSQTFFLNTQRSPSNF